MTDAKHEAPAEGAGLFSVDDLAQEIRRVDGSHNLGAGALAEALMPFLRARSSAPEARDILTVGRQIAHDYQTSETHHPNHVLIRKDQFDALVSILDKQPEAREGEAVAWLMHQTNGVHSYACITPCADYYVEEGRFTKEPLYTHPAAPSADHIGEANEKVTADHAELAAIISDDEIARVHGHANFGPGITPREVVNEGVRKYAVGYHSGHTQLCILMEHGLITKLRPGSYDANLTKKGKKYARVLYRREETLLSEIAALRKEGDGLKRAEAVAVHAADTMADRATQAERQRDELRTEGQKFADFIIQMNAPDQGECLTEDERLMFAVASKFRALIANQGADQ